MDDTQNATASTTASSTSTRNATTKQIHQLIDLAKIETQYNELSSKFIMLSSDGGFNILPIGLSEGAIE